MSNFEKIKYYYTKGIYKQAHIEIFFAKGVLTQTERDFILQDNKEIEDEMKEENYGIFNT